MVNPSTSSEDELYNASTLQWICGYYKYFFSIPLRSWDELKEALLTIYAMFVWFLIAVTFPISLTMLSTAVMITTKRDIKRKKRI